jgi:hypothetical protein
MNLDPTASRLAEAGVAYAPQIATAAKHHGLDPALLAAVAAQETGGPGANAGRNVIGDGGHGHGLFQIDDRWHPFAVTPQAMDPGQNAEYAAGMLEELIGRYGNVREALSAYNAGSPKATGTRTAWPDGEQLGYADSVLRHYGAITGSAAPEQQVWDAAPASSLSGETSALPQTQPPQLATPQSYHRQETDYAGLLDPDDSSTV